MRMPEPHDDPRVPLAVERTMLAWIRTGLALMGFGFVVARLGLFLQEFAIVQGNDGSSSRPSMIVVGTALLTIGAVVNVAAAVLHSREPSARLNGVVPQTVKVAAGIGVATAIMGLGLAIYLALF